MNVSVLGGMGRHDGVVFPDAVALKLDELVDDCLDDACAQLCV